MRLVMTLGSCLPVFALMRGGHEAYLGHEPMTSGTSALTKRSTPVPKPVLHLTDVVPHLRNRSYGHYRWKVNGAWYPFLPTKSGMQSSTGTWISLRPFEFQWAPITLLCPLSRQKS